MSGSLYKLLGLLVWRALRWHLRQRLPSRRLLGAIGLAGLGAVGAAVVIVRRVSG